jgi:hypothetical protein
MRTPEELLAEQSAFFPATWLEPALEAIREAQNDAADEIEHLREKVAFWMRSSERHLEQARRNHDSYQRLWAEHGGPELPPRLEASSAGDEA